MTIPNQSDFELGKMTHNEKLEQIIGPRMENFQEARQEISDLLAQKASGLKENQGARAMTASVAMELLKPIYDLEEKVKALQAQSLEIGGMLKDLKDKEKPMYEKLAELVEITKKMIDRLSAEEGRVTVRVLALMNKQAQNLSEILMKENNQELVNALAWSFGLSPKEGQSLDSYKPQAFGALINEFDRKAFGSPETNSAFFAVSLMDNSTKKEFTDQYLASKSDAEKSQYLWEGNSMGVYPKDEMEAYIQLSEQETETALKRYEVSTQFPEMVKYLKRDKGLTHRDLTIGNLLKHVLAPLIIHTTIAANVGVSIFSGGKFNKPTEIVGNILQNHNIWVALASKAALDAYTGKENFLTSHKETDVKIAHNIKDIMNTSKPLGDFLKHQDGPAVFGGFVREYQHDQGLVGPKTLAQYIDAQLAKPSDEREAQGANLEELKGCFGGKDLDQDKLRGLVKAFSELGLTSSEIKIAREYLDEILENPSKKV